jgi:hypothetical protein
MEEFEFGMDGKPMFISGPYDTEERCERIMRVLEQKRGPGGFNYVAMVSGGYSVEGIADEEDDYEMLESNLPEELSYDSGSEDGRK